MNHWNIYPINAIDFGWDNLPNVEEVAGRIAKTQASFIIQGYGDENADPLGDFLRDYKKALELGGSRGSEGDNREETRVFWLPMENNFAYAFVWKQDNNGDTFVVSPVKLPWLDEHING